MTAEERSVYRYLAEKRICYRLARHHRVSAIKDCVVSEALLGGLMPRNLFLQPRNGSSAFLFILHPESPFRTSHVSRQANSSRLSFGSEEALKQMLHTHPGAVSPLGLIFESAKDVSLLIDRKLLAEKTLIFHPLENTASLRMDAETFFHGFLRSLQKNYLLIDTE